MIVGTVLTAVLVKYTFPYNWDWVESLLFGAMFSATDPVAVVAVLKEVIISYSSATSSIITIWRQEAYRQDSGAQTSTGGAVITRRVDPHHTKCRLGCPSS